MTCMELWEISLGPTPLIVAASEQVYARVCACARMCAGLPECQPRHFPGSLSQRGHVEGKKQHHKTNGNSTRSVDRELIVASCGKGEVYNNNINMYHSPGLQWR